MTVRQLARAVDDGYEHDLLPGVNASSDARRLAAALAASQQRLDELDADYWYGQAAAAGTDGGLWLLLQTAVIGAAEGQQPFAALERCVTRWPAEAALPDLPDLEGIELGPRAAANIAAAAAVLKAFRALIEHRGDVQTALGFDAPGSPQARFDRVFERLSLRGFSRTQRIEFLVTGHALGLIKTIDPWSLRLADARALDPVIVAAKRLFGIGDALLLARRLRALCDAVEVSVAAADLALYNWGVQSRSGSYLPGGQVAASERVAEICAVLSVTVDKNA